MLYTVDDIEDAIIRKKKIAFNYFHLNEKAERDYVKTSTGERKRYYVEPVALIFNEDNYYLMAYSSKHPESRASYRIDRIDRLELVKESNFVLRVSHDYPQLCTKSQIPCVVVCILFNTILQERRSFVCTLSFLFVRTRSDRMVDSCEDYIPVVEP